MYYNYMWFTMISMKFKQTTNHDYMGLKIGLHDFILEGKYSGTYFCTLNL